MVDVSIGNETSPEANRQTEGQADDGQTGGQTGKPMSREAALPKMHLRMEFDSGVGPTCSCYCHCYRKQK